MNKTFPRVIETSSNTPADSGTVSISLSGTSPTMTFIGAGTSAGRVFNDDLATGETCLVHIYQTNDPSLWCEAQVTFTDATPDTLTFVAADVKYGSAGAGTLVTWTGTVTCELGVSAEGLRRSIVGAQSIIPGGRLTLESGEPITDADKTAKTHLFYCPLNSNVMVLWDGSDWVPIIYAEYDLTLGTLANTYPHSVFAYLSGGSLAIELTAWTNDSTPGSAAVSIQDGRYCKTGDKTRLWLGVIAPKTTTTLEDSLSWRGVWNLYNQRCRVLYKDTGSSNHTYTTDASLREYNGTTGTNIVTFVIGLVEVAYLNVFSIVQSTVAGGSAVCIGIDSATATTGGVPQVFAPGIANQNVTANASAPIKVAAGKHIAYLQDRNLSTGDLTANYGNMTITLDA